MVGHKAKMHHAKRHAEKIQMKKQLKAHDERNVKQKDDGAVQEGALPTYLLDREGQKVGRVIVCLCRIANVTLMASGRKSTLIRHQRSQKGQGCEIRCTPTESPRYRRRGDVQSHQDR
jgi:hypothetical protein